LSGSRPSRWIALDRAERDFSEEDRGVLDLLGPHLVHARANAAPASTITARDRATPPKATA
jgi:hypothetical protein